MVAPPAGRHATQGGSSFCEQFPKRPAISRDPPVEPRFPRTRPAGLSHPGQMQRGRVHGGLGFGAL